MCVCIVRASIRRWQGYIKSLVKEEEGGKPGWNWGEVTGRKRRCGSNLLRSDSSAPSPSCAWAPTAAKAVGWTFFSLFFGFGRTHTHHCQSSVWWWAPPFQWSSSSVRKSKRRREEMIWIIQSSGGGAWCSSPGKKNPSYTTGHLAPETKGKRSPMEDIDGRCRGRWGWTIARPLGIIGSGPPPIVAWAPSAV